MNPSCTRQWLTVAISDGSVEVRDMPENLLNRLIQYPVSIIVVTVSTQSRNVPLFPMQKCPL